MNLSQWIRDRRTAAGFTRTDLAEKADVTQSIASQWERGAAEPAPPAPGRSIRCGRRSREAGNGSESTRSLEAKLQ